MIVMLYQPVLIRHMMSYSCFLQGDQGETGDTGSDGRPGDKVTSFSSLLSHFESACLPLSF